VSYPKSGNTWTRFLLANLIRPAGQIDFTNIDSVVSDAEALTRRRLNKLSRPRVIKSHYSFDPRYQSVIYVVRDPRDVALSQYYFHIKRGVIEASHSLDLFMDRFLIGETSRYGSWGEHVGGWFAARQGSPRFIVIRYEDMLTDTTKEMARIAVFLGIKPEPDRIAKAICNSSADTMRRLERAQANVWASTKDTRKDILFVRAAKSGGWRAEMSAGLVAKLESAWAPLMKNLGYRLECSRMHAD
jgi:Sulfotransferase domain